jgi:glycosyltransferase involved in cell wall biosynthesis
MARVAAQPPLTLDIAPEAGPSVSLSVIIPHLENIEALGLTLDSLAAQTTGPLEILIVENGSPEQAELVTALVADTNLPAIVLYCAERGAGPARNQGARHAKGEVLAFLDADCRPAPDWLERGYAIGRTSGIAGGPVQVKRATGGTATPEEIWDVMFGHDATKSYRHHRHLLGGNLFVRREIFNMVGEFRNGFPEDRDWCERAIQLGFVIVFDEHLVVFHAPLASYAQLRRRWLRMTREEYVRAKARPYGMIKYLSRSILIALSIFPHGSKIFTSSAVPRRLKMSTLWVLIRLRCLRFLTAWKLFLQSKTVK